MIRSFIDSDASAIADIYNYYIQNTVITFEEAPLSAKDICERACKVRKQGFSWLVALENDQVIGYAYAAEWNSRPSYRFSCEVTVYLDHNLTSKGWGTKLYSRLFEELRQKEMHAVIAGITLPNERSEAIHEKFGMEKIAHYSEVGNKFGSWLDVGYWQVIL